MAKSTYTKTICVSGRAIDGRNVKAEWLTSAADAYDPKVYTALINVEHLRGGAPSSEFGNYGQVLSLKTEERDGMVALVAEIELNDKGIATRKANEKPFWSAELSPDYPSSGQYYLSGLAMTNSPACGHTEPIQLSAGAAPVLYCDSVADDDATPTPTEAEAVRSIFSFFSSLGKSMAKQDPAADALGKLNTALEALSAKVDALGKPEADEPEADPVAALSAKLETLSAKVDALGKPEADKPEADPVAALSAKIDELVVKLSTAEGRRPSDMHAGGGSAAMTDC